MLTVEEMAGFSHSTGWGVGYVLLPVCVRSEMYLHSLKADTILNSVMLLPEMYPKFAMGVHRFLSPHTLWRTTFVNVANRKAV